MITETIITQQGATYIFKLEPFSHSFCGVFSFLASFFFLSIYHLNGTPCVRSSMFLREDEVLQDIPGVHASPGAEEASWGWLQEAQKDHEKV